MTGSTPDQLQLTASWRGWAHTLRCSYDSRTPDEGVEVRTPAGQLLQVLPMGEQPVQPGLTLGVLFPVAGVWLAAEDRAHPTPRSTDA